MRPLEGAYITLFLHQVHRWFGEAAQGRAGLVRFLGAAKSMGYDAIMADVPWAWTEREGEGKFDFESFGKGAVARSVCAQGLRLHVVVNMRELPPWVRS